MIPACGSRNLRTACSAGVSSVALGSRTSRAPSRTETMPGKERDGLLLPTGRAGC